MFPVPSSLKASTWVKNEMIGSSLWFWFNVDLFCSHYCAGRSLKLLIALPLPWCRFSRVRWRLAPEPNQPQLRQKRVEVSECFSLSLSELCQENAYLIFVKPNQPQLRQKRIQLRCRDSHFGIDENSHLKNDNSLPYLFTFLNGRREWLISHLKMSSQTRNIRRLYQLGTLLIFLKDRRVIPDFKLTNVLPNIQ